MPCIQCAHGQTDYNLTHVCTACLRQLHTVLTFNGPLIVDMQYYIDVSWHEYAVMPGDLLLWTFEEEEIFSLSGPPRVKHEGITEPPPHHRF